jgi:competence protein ComFC
MSNQLTFQFTHLLLAPRCLGCRRRLPPDSNAFCRACIRYFLGAPSLKGALFEHSGPGKGFLSALRGTAPQRAAAWGIALLERRNVFKNWDGVELVMHAPQNARRAQSGLALLAEGVAKRIGAQFVRHAFRKSEARTQHGRTRIDRMDTPCFLELARPPGWVKGKSVLVLDDVNTTGTTLEQCAYRLIEAGAAQVKKFALAEQAPPSR